MAKLIIGITGQLGAGKDTVAQFLERRGFFHIRLSDLLREEFRRRGIGTFTRKDLQDIGDEMRAKFGGDVLARRALERASQSQTEKIVLSSIRNPVEIEYLRNHSNFHLFGLVASKEIRFKRKLDSERSDDGDIKTWGDFMMKDARDAGEGQEEYGQQVNACLEQADFIIDNSETLEELFGKIEKILKTLDEN